MTIERGVGILVPSSNRTVERTTEAILHHFPALGACYARIPLWGDARSGGQRADGYEVGPILEAAELLAHAKIELLCWNGTKGASLGFAPDRQLLAALGERTGIAGVSTALATLEVLERADARRIALLIPGAAEGTAKIAAGFEGQGLAVVATRSLGITDNFACAEIAPATFTALAGEVARDAAPDAILVFNTNARGLEAMRTFDVPQAPLVLDSTAIGVWAILDALGVDKSPARGFGRLFAL
jgi:maleate isomerase